MTDPIQFTGTREEFLAKAREMMTEDGLPDEVEMTWRDLALQFDNHRIDCMSMIRYLVHNIEEYATVRDILKQPLSNAKLFLSKPPLRGSEVLQKRLTSLAALQTPHKAKTP